MTDIRELENVATPIAQHWGCDIVLLTFAREKQGWVLRVLVEKTGADPAKGSGVDHQTCAGISRELDDLIESAELIDRAYVLEVSSPGIERPLTCPGDFQRFADREVKIRTKHAIDNRKRFQGVILSSDTELVRVRVGKKILEIPHASIAKANLVFVMKDAQDGIRRF